MRLLICTQAVDLDDPVLGFFHRWIEELAKKCESVEVICLKEGRHALPPNVHVHSLGKEVGVSRIKYVIHFYRYIFSLSGRYDCVFVHMNPEYAVLGGIFWRLWHKRTILWYSHREVNLKLRLAVLLVQAVASTARESITLKSRKIRIVGHGIDVEKFAAQPLRSFDARAPRIVSVGRITPIKNIETTIAAVAKLRERGIAATLDLIGEPVVEPDHVYKAHLQELIGGLGLKEYVSFLGSVKNSEMAQAYARYDLSVNACPNGGIDKAVLESMAAGVVVFAANEGFRSYFEELSDDLLFAYGDTNDLAHKIERLLHNTDNVHIQLRLRQLVREKADVTRVISVIMQSYV